MAQDSKAKRAARRLKRQNTLYRMTLQVQEQNSQLRRVLEFQQQHSTQIRAVLYAILTQKGGEIVSAFTKGTMEQVQQSFARLSIEVTPLKTDPDSYTVQLVEAPEQQPQQEATSDVGPESLRDAGPTGATGPDMVS